MKVKFKASTMTMHDYFLIFRIHFEKNALRYDVRMVPFSIIHEILVFDESAVQGLI